MSEMLTAGVARSYGAANAEDIIQYVCDGCPKGNLDFTSLEFCPIQVNYGSEGEDPHILCEIDTRGMRVWCTRRREMEGA